MFGGSGSFVCPAGSPFDRYAVASIALGDPPFPGPPTTDHTGTVTWWVDPDGWDDGSTPQPPMPGQWVYGEPITMTGNAGATAWPFADGSLQIHRQSELARVAAEDVWYAYRDGRPALGTSDDPNG